MAVGECLCSKDKCLYTLKRLKYYTTTDLFLEGLFAQKRQENADEYGI